MELGVLTDALKTAIGTQLPAIAGALLILVAGWIAAVVLRALVRGLLRWVHLDARIADSTEQPIHLENAIAALVFWIAILATMVGVLNALDLGSLSLPLASLMSDFLGYLPNLIAGTLLVVLAWIVATLVRRISARALAATQLDDRLALQAGMPSIGPSLSAMLFWLVLLLFLPAVLSAYQLGGILDPIQAMIARLLDQVPRLVGAAALAAVGWLVAGLLRGLVTSTLAAAGIDRINEQLGLEPGVRLSRLAGTLVFILVFVPTLISALDSAGVEAISGPASTMLAQFLAAVPRIVAAAAILLLTFYVGRFVARFLTQLLANAGFDAVPYKLGLRGNPPEETTTASPGPAELDEPAESTTAEMGLGVLRPSVLAGRLVILFAMLFALAEAADQLGFSQVRDLVTTFVRFGGDVLLGAVILIVGFWLANLLHRALSRSQGPSWAAQVGRAAVLGLVLAMGLRAMGVANEIVQLAFGLTLGAVAVAVALAFGLGGREAAGRMTQRWVDTLLAAREQANAPHPSSEHQTKRAEDPANPAGPELRSRGATARSENEGLPGTPGDKA
jgi:Conserved TM helix